LLKDTGQPPSFGAMNNAQSLVGKKRKLIKQAFVNHRQRAVALITPRNFAAKRDRRASYLHNDKNVNWRAKSVMCVFMSQRGTFSSVSNFARGEKIV
jgi:hypothetical protein